MTLLLALLATAQATSVTSNGNTCDATALACDGATDDTAALQAALELHDIMHHRRR
jgi:hypothetical protein